MVTWQCLEMLFIGEVMVTRQLLEMRVENPIIQMVP